MIQGTLMAFDACRCTEYTAGLCAACAARRAASAPVCATLSVVVPVEEAMRRIVAGLLAALEVEPDDRVRERLRQIVEALDGTR